MKKKVWILNHHANSMYFDEGGRHYCFAKYLKRAGYDPVIFCSNSEHGTGKVYFNNLELWQEHMSDKIKVPFVFVKGRPYMGNGKNRILCMLDYYFCMRKVAKEYIKKDGCPDIIIGSSVHPLACVAGIRIAKKLGIKCIVEIRDLWPESIIAYNLAKRNNPIIQLLFKLEKWIYCKANAIIFTTGGGKDYITEKGWEKKGGKGVDLNHVFYLNNGVDLEDFDYNKNNYKISDSDLIDDKYTKVVYVGSIRHVNNVGAILDVAKEVNSRIKFLIWGDGDEVDGLKQRVHSERIFNVVFKGKVEKKYVPFIVSNADINLMDMQESNEIFRFGISPNKLFEYFAAKKPIVMYQLNDYNPALEYQVGFVANDFCEIKNYINLMSESENNINYERDENYELARNAFSYVNLTKKLIDIIEKV